MNSKFIRNFSIIAHIDHGKSTLADRLMENTGTIDERDMRGQFLDNMDIERERGITIKSQTVRVRHLYRGETFYLNLIDTPGHVDFAYEVSRSLAACDGAVLVVDASQGVEAQTLANVYMAIGNDLEIIPVINKIDLPHADPDRVKKEIEEIIGIDARDALLVSAKTGAGVNDLLDKIVELIPPPKGDVNSPLQALVFDSWFDSYQGVILLIRVVCGKINLKDKIYLKHSAKEYEVLKLGINTPYFQDVTTLSTGEVGMLICGIKNLRDVRVGDTVVSSRQKDTPNLPGFEEIRQMVFCGIFPVDSVDFSSLKDSLDKLSLNDSSFSYRPENSTALGLGLHCGFLGLLHMNIVQERLEREFKLNIISTAPSCKYEVITKKGESLIIDNPSLFPDTGLVEKISEPVVELSIHLPKEYLGRIIGLCEERRGMQKEIKYITPTRAQLTYHLPLSEMIFDFYDRLKGLTKGYASMDYSFIGYHESDLVKLDILLNGDKVDALSMICHRSMALRKGRILVEKLQKLISRHQYDIAVQAVVGQKVLARETIKALRKNVLAKCYGGDITRKRKLLEKQKAGKKRMKVIGQVEVPQEAFLAVLKIDE
jgi:GTP-binding protein LepA